MQGILFTIPVAVVRFWDLKSSDESKAVFRLQPLGVLEAPLF